MTGSLGEDPLHELRQSDPANRDALPSASLARVRTRVQETISMEEHQAGRRSWWPIAAGVAMAAVALIAIIALPGVRPGASGPGATADPTSGGGMASCVEQYSLAALGERDFAFDGTLVSTSGESATFAIDTSFRGVDGEEVTLSAPGMTGTAITSAGGPTLVVGQRYLVAGDDRFVWACGFTQDYDPDVAGAWAAALD